MKMNCHPAEQSRRPGAAGLAVRHRAAGVPSRRGIALVITLIMLSVTLVMAVAFLALARRERNSVSTTTDTTTARLAADSALAAAQAQIVANILSTNSALYNFGLLISTNYINTNGFNPLVGGANPTNVNYSHRYLSSAPLSAVQFIQNVANLQILPRVPVFIQTNDAGSNDFRFYLDLNRNGQFDDTAYIDNSVMNGPLPEVGDPQWIGLLERPDAVHASDNQFVSRYAFIALPIGNGLDINAMNNQSAVQRVNSSSSTSIKNGYLRNEGIGSWELNLAAFLADLNVNQWDPPGTGNDYQYLEPTGFANTGAAFQDALSILSYRYNYDYRSLNLLGGPGGIFPNNYQYLENKPIDVFPTGSLLISTRFPDYANVPTDPVRSYWAGSANTNHFYDLPDELFNPTQTSPDFTNRLISAGNSTTNYDRYTYYRLLSQLGTDSDPDDGKINLNFRNVTNGVVVPGMETNLYPWSAIEFFTNAADRMLRMYTTNWYAANPSAYLATYYNLSTNGYIHYYYDGFGNRVTNDPSGFGLTNRSFSLFLGWTNQVPAFGITNIPVFVNGQFVYSPSVNRVLQMAANLYDATSTNFYPSVFRPLFAHDHLGNVFIVGYTNLSFNGIPNIVSGPSDPQLSLPLDITAITNAGVVKFGGISGLINTNVYGVPWIIGAKKNLPAFNQFSMLNQFQAERVLQIGRKSLASGGWGPVYTNHMYLLSVSNLISASFWNSYSNNYPTNYPGNLNLGAYVEDTVEMVMTNSDHPGVRSVQFFTTNFVFFPKVWPGSKWSPSEASGIPAADAFLASSWTNSFIPMEIYKTKAEQFVSIPDPSGDPFESNNYSCDPLPQFGLMTTNWLRTFILDGPVGRQHVVDYVQLRGPTDGTNVTAVVNDPPSTQQGPGQVFLWATNFYGIGPTPSWGYVNQINISQGSGRPPASAQWNNPSLPSIPGLDSVTAAQDFLHSMFTPSSTFNYTVNGVTLTYTNTEPVVQAGYSAIRTTFVPYLYQVNDPLVHYLASDLNAGAGATWGGNQAVPNGIWAQNDGVVSVPFPAPPNNNDIPKSRYQPWGVSAPTALQANAYNFSSAYNLIYKDPLVWGADYWEFPTNIYPSVGWIGRVHRGTPWQTVYLKAHDVVHFLANTNIINQGTNTWAAWTGNINTYDAAGSAPVQDRLLFDLFTARLNDNASLGTLSVNQTNLAAWSAVFSGIVVLTNNADYPNSTFPPGIVLPTSYGTNIIQPAAVNVLLQTLVKNINFARASTNVPYNLQFGFTNTDGVLGSFEHAGDILATPALTENSPFLNWSNVNQQKFGISDATYEWLPQQMMGLVRGTSAPRYVLYCYGQALRPAPNGLVTSPGNFGLVTNYQVVAESGVRAVVSVQAQVDMSGSYPVTNYTTKVESYNVLPPN